ncbi:MAG: dihydrolipoyl dehydrogenase [Gammaproteobacteria bacterium]|nr:dihydrolipoyl dehydrogenase [Gammaproteobacteria bacterium]
MTRKVDVAIIGAGSAGLYALSQVKRFTDNFVLIDGGELGTTCARVGCMPSKAMIQVAEDFHRKSIFNREGIEGSENLVLNQADAMEYIQDLRDTFVDRTLSHSIDQLDDTKLIESNAKFIAPHLLETEDGTQIQADKIILATGSSPFIPSDWKQFSDHIITTNELFELEDLPKSIAVIGLGVIGLEIGQALSRMGVDVTGIDQKMYIGGISDDLVNSTAIDIFNKEFPLWLGHPANVSHADNNRLKVTAGDSSVIVDKLLLSIGRAPNINSLNLEAAEVTTLPSGVPVYNPSTMQTTNPHIFMAGDITGSNALLHEAGFEGRIAGYNAMQKSPVSFRQKTHIGITFSDPNIISVGQNLHQLDQATITIGEIKLAPVGRALIMGKNKGIIRLYAETTSGKLLGASMVSVKGENLAHLLCWAIEMNLTVYDLLKMPFYHPVIEEALQAALYDLRSKLPHKDHDLPVELQME